MIQLLDGHFPEETTRLLKYNGKKPARFREENKESLCPECEYLLAVVKKRGTKTIITRYACDVLMRDPNRNHNTPVKAHFVHIYAISWPDPKGGREYDHELAWTTCPKTSVTMPPRIEQLRMSV